MLNGAFADLTNESTDYYPPDLRSEIDAVNDLVYANVNNGVYRAALPPCRRPTRKRSAACSRRSTTSIAACRGSATSLARALTEADWRLFPTLIRFDAVYYSHFKCNLRRIGDYDNLSNYLRDLYQVPASTRP